MPTSSLQNMIYSYIYMTGSTQATNAMERNSKALSHQLETASRKHFYSCSMYKGVEPIRQTDGGIRQSVEPKLLATLQPVVFVWVFFLCVRKKFYSLENGKLFCTREMQTGIFVAPR